MSFWDRVRGVFRKEELAKKPSRLPLTSAPRDIPVTSIVRWDSVDSVVIALDRHETGTFDQSALLCDSMMRDDRINATLQQRIKALLGQEMEFHASDDESAQAETAAEWFEDHYGVIVSEEAANEFLRWAHMLGVAVGELVWDTVDGLWRPRLRVYHPRYLYWRWDTRSYWLTTMDGTQEVTPGDGRWVFYSPGGAQRGWMAGMVRPLAIPFLLRKYTYRDWARFSEVYGAPIRKGKVPASDTDENKKRFLQQLVNLSTETSIVLPQNAEGKGYDLELLEATATNWQAFDKLIERTEDSIQIMLLGQTLTTGAKSGGLGTGGVAQVHKDVRDDLLKSDAKSFGQTVKEQIFKPAAAYNWGDEDLAPSLAWEIDPPEDLGAKATTLSTLGDAISKLKAAGVPVDAEAVAEEYQIPLLSPAERAAQEAEDTQRMVERQKAMNEVSPAGPDGSEPPPPGGKGPREKLSVTKPAGFVEGQLYADDLADNAKLHGSKAIAPDLHTVLAIIQGASSYEELRHKLMVAYKGMSGEQMREVMHKAILLAELSGRKAVLEDL